MIYKKYIKRFLAIVLSTLAIICLSWLLIIFAIIIKVTSKGPVFFKQKRVGKNKTYFSILKFRTMRVDTPKDMPTHMLENPEQYITKIGKFLRKTSLDELPQLFNIFLGQMAIVGPRPALWNQEDLIAEREQYHANDVRPGLTGLAQVSGRDELSISVKARYDGEYVDNIGFKKDVLLILQTVRAVAKHDGVKEGKWDSDNHVESEYASSQEEYIPYKNRMNNTEQNVLIIGAHSYIGKALGKYLQDDMNVTMVSASDGEWKTIDLSQYTTIIHLSAIVHKREKKNMKELFQKVNCELPVQIARKAKEAGVRQFIFISTASVYGSKINKITVNTVPDPDTLYGRSKLDAEKYLKQLEELEYFKVSIIRPPLVYGDGCKGNYAKLQKVARYLVFFPKIHNKRSMISINKLCEVIENNISNYDQEIILPQDDKYYDTSLLIKDIRKKMGKKTILIPGFTWILRLFMKQNRLLRKIFGDWYYE